MEKHEENGEVTEELSHEDRFGQAFDEIDPATPEPPAEPEAEDVADADEPKEETPPPIEGPSLAMKNLAKQQGVPPNLIETARDDEQLEAWMGMVAERQETPEPAPEYSPSLPDDEFPDDDPVRQEFVSLKKNSDEQFGAYYQALTKLAEDVYKQQEVLDSMQVQTAVAEQESFNERLDSYENKVLGTKNHGSKAADKVRGLIHETFLELQKELPGTPDSVLIDKAAATFGYSSQKQLRNNAVRKQSQQRLGGPEGSKAPPELKLSRQENTFTKWDDIFARSGS